MKEPMSDLIARLKQKRESPKAFHMPKDISDVELDEVIRRLEAADSLADALDKIETVGKHYFDGLSYGQPYDCVICEEHIEAIKSAIRAYRNSGRPE